MSYLIVGLGNPGEKYAETRHNIGFKVLDAWAHQDQMVFDENKWGWLAKTSFKGRTIWLLKPNTYMNLSGKAVSYWLQKEKITIENLLVITDDLALPEGALKLKSKGSDGGHNGLKSINESLQTTSYARLRFGIGNHFAKGKQVDYVLGEWTEEEKAVVALSIPLAIDACKSFAFLGPERAMNLVNTKKPT